MVVYCFLSGYMLAGSRNDPYFANGLWPLGMDECGIEARGYLMQPNSIGSITEKRDSLSPSLSGPSATLGQARAFGRTCTINSNRYLRQISLKPWQKASSHGGVSLGFLAIPYMALQADSTVDYRTQFGPLFQPQ